MALLRNLAIIAATVACLVTVQVLLAPVFSEPAKAVSHRSGIAALGHNGWVLDIHGHVWNSLPGECWTRRPDYDPPVPIEEIDLWDNHALVTIDGVLWRHGNEGWESCGPWPDGPVSVGAGGR